PIYVGGKAPHSSDRVMWTVSAGHCAGGRTSRLRWSGLPQSPTGRAGRSLGWWTPAPAPGFQFFRAEALDRVGRTRRDPAEPGAAVPEAPKVFLTHHRYHSLCISSDSSKFTLSALSVWSRDVRSVTTRRCAVNYDTSKTPCESPHRKFKLIETGHPGVFPWIRRIGRPIRGSRTPFAWAVLSFQHGPRRVHLS